MTGAVDLGIGVIFIRFLQHLGLPTPTWMRFAARFADNYGLDMAALTASLGVMQFGMAGLVGLETGQVALMGTTFTALAPALMALAGFVFAVALVASIAMAGAAIAMAMAETIQAIDAPSMERYADR
jgi:hypothetical protein